MLCGWKGKQQVWWKVMAAYHQVYDSIVTCLETGTSSCPNACALNAGLYLFR